MSAIIMNWLKKIIVLSSIMSAVAFIPVASSSPWELETEVIPGGVDPYWYVNVRITSWDTFNTRPNPLHNCNVCQLYIMVGDIWGSGRIPQMIIYVPDGARGSKTLGELGEYLMRRGYFNKTYSDKLVGGSPGKVCFYLGYPNQGQGGVPYHRIEGGQDFCFHKIIPSYCDFYMPKAELRHGLLGRDKVNGNVAST
ncbi:MAG: hypothetical protein E6651_18075, partial [Acinetobacter sp.]